MVASAFGDRRRDPDDDEADEERDEDEVDALVARPVGVDPAGSDLPVPAVSPTLSGSKSSSFTRISKTTLMRILRTTARKKVLVALVLLTLLGAGVVSSFPP